MVISLQKLIHDYRYIMMFISSFIALLPIQGGATFSAPMIKSIGENNNTNPEKYVHKLLVQTYLGIFAPLSRDHFICYIVKDF